MTSGKWSGATSLAKRPYAGADHAAEVIGGKLYLFGGVGTGAEGKVQIYDPGEERLVARGGHAVLRGGAPAPR